MVSRSFPSSFSPWVFSLVTSSTPCPVSPSLVSSVALGSSASVASVGGLNLAQPSSGGLTDGVSSAPSVAGSSFAMSSILAPVSCYFFWCFCFLVICFGPFGSSCGLVFGCWLDS